MDSTDAASPDHEGAVARVAPLASVANLLRVGALVLLGVSIGSEWATEKGFGESRTAARFTTQFLWDDIPADFDNFPLLWPIGAAMALILVGLVRQSFSALAMVGGVGAVLISLLFLKSVNSLLDAWFMDGIAFGDCVGNGVWMCLAAGVAAITGGVLLKVAGRQAAAKRP